MKNTIQLSLVTILLLAFGACASLPQQVPGEGVVILPLVFENSTTRPEPIHKIDLLLSDGTMVRFVPKNGFVVLRGTDPALTIKGVRVSLKDEGWHGSDKTVPVNVPLLLEPGKIRYMGVKFLYSQTSEGSRSYYGRWNLTQLLPAEYKVVQAKVRADGNFKYWTD